MDDVKNKSNSHSIYIVRESYSEWHRKVGVNYAPYIVDTEDYYLLYCENEWRTMGSSYSHWTNPIDLTTWILVIFTAGFVALVGARFKMRDLTLRVLDSLAIILRNPMGNMERFYILHVLLTLCFLCISLQYESVLTSQITIPAPPLVAKDLKELISGKGFKMLFPVVDKKDLKLYDLTEFKSGFEKYGIQDFYPNIQGQDSKRASKMDCLANKTNKLATDIPSSNKAMTILDFGIASFKNDRHCHFAIEPFFKRHNSMQIRGYRFWSFIRLFHLFREVGLEGMWVKNYKWYAKFWSMRRFMKLNQSALVFAKYSKDHWAPHKAMELTDKFVQIFAICGVIASCGIFCWIWEIFYGNHLTIRNIRKFLG
ncbi:hypothetical protein Fcan01_28016 [Folsomia candida]|uniref:Uncharacterized protein n=2 Tax=Folsomia candida TaxID=158441 RepID=A0A226CWR4_FOLCA|nr:hypothetical protein Fcan01_28016 [Folsomia candida]